MVLSQLLKKKKVASDTGVSSVTGACIYTFQKGRGFQGSVHITKFKTRIWRSVIPDSHVNWPIFSFLEKGGWGTHDSAYFWAITRSGVLLAQNVRPMRGVLGARWRKSRLRSIMFTFDRRGQKCSCSTCCTVFARSRSYSRRGSSVRTFKRNSYSLRESRVKAEQPLMLLLNRLQPFTPTTPHTHTHTLKVHRELYANVVEAPQPFERKWARMREWERESLRGRSYRLRKMWFHLV